ncbi:glutathione S-transferase family protein [Shewanella schlegeliana]|uniref:Glutathione S-transferase family protein n=1 Tax=Shewanella schlegeliana TaxID=190308 RepID=A0ABS1T4G5_9GAMM|nr:glutathione S-transferase family protein [Shewanella schlegeliana]MBL4914747.1 glutathione S-transferase family protein [Shewanella schlegeliana]MCL1109921.1 glutathione S-transferase family protein [Shewanella schlegeliana]GIU25644.1 glutathione S-transferase [Shewanella schlegeliana]
MDLYYHPLARQSQKTLIALYEKQASFSPHIIDLGDAFSRRSFQQLNAEAKLPLLHVRSKEFFNDASIIIEYIDNYISSGTQLIPIDKTQALYVRLYDRLSDHQLDREIDAWLEAINTSSNQIHTKRLERTMLASLDHFDRRLANNHWVCGESFSLADCAFIPCLKALESRLQLLDYEHIGRYWIQAKLRGSVSQMLEEIELTLASIGQTEQRAHT